MNTLKHFLTLLLIFSFCNSCFAQNLERKIQKEKRKIQNFFLKDLPRKNTPDSTMIIGFSFKISVQENEKRIKQVISITANDSVAYKLFPNYESLKKIDYKLFMKDKNKADFIIPILIEMVSSQADKYLTDEKLKDFMNERTFFTTIKHDPRSLFHNVKEEKDRIENYTYFEPVLIWIDKRKKMN